MKAKWLFFSFLLILASSAKAQIVPNKAGDFLAIDDAQQEIYYGRWLNANRALVNECMPGWTDQQALKFYVNWLQDNPQYFERALQQTFSQSMMFVCKRKPITPPVQ